MLGLSRHVDTAKRIIGEFSEKNVTLLAAAVAYNAFLSLAPILVLLLVVVTAVGGGLEDRVVALAQENFPGPIADLVVEVFRGGAGDPAASVVGLVVLVWGSLKLFRGLDSSFSEIYETTEEVSFSGQVADGLVVLGALVLAVLATVGVTAVFAALGGVIPYIGLLTPLVLVGGLLLAFLPIYRRFPDANVGWREALPGAAFAAVGWAAFQALFQVYFTFSGGGSDSLFGGVVVVITWLYFSGLVLLLGAVINAVLGGHTGEPDEEPEIDAPPEPRLWDVTETDGTIMRQGGLDADEFATYLRGLRETLTGRYERMRPTADPDLVARLPPPDGDVSVVERSAPQGDRRALSVTLSWWADGRADDSKLEERLDPQERSTPPN